ncbi:hypothetical protein [Luteimicrobium subarcticum]|uniref:Uncharacterized protein n=1 Tax=Luteimicrobium subarcticum TaxID=620910 RepID=A0A2M8W3J6_9MICO|nr:hypothetical protein [Luteimicrobium subarcticum]PJI85512.1 hypothetical protein CLV34_3026 [Luteimicrobium subarcticum]
MSADLCCRSLPTAWGRTAVRTAGLLLLLALSLAATTGWWLATALLGGSIDMTWAPAAFLTALAAAVAYPVSRALRQVRSGDAGRATFLLVAASGLAVVLAAALAVAADPWFLLGM